MDTAFLITSFATLFVVIDPPGLVPMFIALTQGMTPAQRRAIAFRACVISAGLLTLFALAGDSILSFIGISMPAFRIAGGLLLFLTAIDMLFERRTQRREDRANNLEHHDPSVFPLATPLIAGPGAITTVILLVSADPSWSYTAALLGLVYALLLLLLGFLMLSPLFERLLGRTGTLVITRLLGILLAALSVQFVIDGLLQSGLF